MGYSSSISKLKLMTLSKDVLEIFRDQDVVLLRNRIKETTTKIKMSLVNQTKLITAASELVRNMLKYAKGGIVIIEIVTASPFTGVRLTFEDTGPGIPDIDQAMKDGFTTGKSLGVGLGGAKRLVNEFEIKSEIEKGTTITIIKWKNG